MVPFLPMWITLGYALAAWAAADEATAALSNGNSIPLVGIGVGNLGEFSLSTHAAFHSDISHIEHEFPTGRPFPQHGLKLMNIFRQFSRKL